MKSFGLTGGIGMGKSTAADFLKARGVPVLDTDAVARAVVEPGQPALKEVAARFGAEVIGADGNLRREELARRVFGDAAARKDLEAILHPRIRVIWQAQLQAWKDAGCAVGVVIIPLLFEINLAANFDRTICVACSMASQQERLLKRGWSAEQCQRRLSAQLPVEKKMALADFVIWTEGPLAVTGEQLALVGF